MPGNLQRCTFCGLRPPEKLSQTTWAWLKADGDRVAYRQKLCISCFCTNVLAYDNGTATAETLTCPACGIGTEEDFDAIYVTAYVPGSGKMQFSMPMCGPHAVELRQRAMKNSEALPNLERGVGGQAPNTTSPAELPWYKLGLTARE